MVTTFSIEVTNAFKMIAEACRKYVQHEKVIDWEQRRYEIAKDLYSSFPALSEDKAVERADLLISALKKKKV